MCQNNKRIEEFSIDWWKSALNEAEHVHDLDEIRVVRPPKIWNLNSHDIKFENIHPNDIIEFNIVQGLDGGKSVQQRVVKIDTTKGRLYTHDIRDGKDIPEARDLWVKNDIENYWNKPPFSLGEAKKLKPVDPALYQQFLDLLPNQLETLTRVYGNKDLVSSYLADPAMKDALAKEVLSQMSDHYDQAERMYGTELVELGKKINGEKRSKDKLSAHYHAQKGIKPHKPLDEIRLIKQIPELTELENLIKKYEEIHNKLKEIGEIYGNNSVYARQATYMFLYNNVIPKNLDKSNKDKILEALKYAKHNFETDKKHLRNLIKVYYKNRHQKWKTKYGSHEPVDHSIIALKKIYQDDLGGEEILSEIRIVGKVTPKMIMDLCSKINFNSIPGNNGWGLSDWLDKYGWVDSPIELPTDWMNSLPQSILQEMYKELISLSNKYPLNEIKMIGTKLPGINFLADTEQEFTDNIRNIWKSIYSKNKLKLDPNDQNYYPTYNASQKEFSLYLKKYRKDLIEKWSEIFKNQDISSQFPLLSSVLKSQYGDQNIILTKVEPFANQVSSTIRNRLLKLFDVNPKNISQYEIKYFEGKMPHIHVMTYIEQPYNAIKGIYHENENKLYLLELLYKGLQPVWGYKIYDKNSNSINESIDKSSIIKDFIKFACKKLGVKSNGCKVTLTKDKSQTTTYAHYNPSTKHIVVYTQNRSLGDVLRSLCHELVHHKQNLENDLGPESGNTGSPQENEANSVAGIIMREFGAKYPQIFEAKNTSKELLNEIKVMGNISVEMLNNLNGSIEIYNSEWVSIIAKYNKSNFHSLYDIFRSLNQNQRNNLYKDLLKYKNSLNTNESLDTYTQQNIAKVIKGFDLAPYPKGFHNAYTTKNAKATPLLAKQINKFLNNTLLVTSIKCFYEPTYQTVNFVVSNDRSKLDEIRVVKKLSFNYDDLSLYEAISKVSIYLRDEDEEFILVKPDQYLELFNLGNYYTWPPPGGANHIYLIPKNFVQIRKKINIEDTFSTETYPKEKRIEDLKEQFEYIKEYLDKGLYKILFTKDEIPDDLTEIKMIGQVSPQMVDELIDKLTDENKYQYFFDLGIADKYDRDIYIDYRKWLTSLTKPQLRDLYSDLIKIQNMKPYKVDELEPQQLPFEESFSKEFWKEALELDEIRIIGRVDPKIILPEVKKIRGKIINKYQVAREYLPKLKIVDDLMEKYNCVYNSTRNLTPENASLFLSDLRKIEKELELDQLDEIRVMSPKTLIFKADGEGHYIFEQDGISILFLESINGKCDFVTVTHPSDLNLNNKKIEEIKKFIELLKTRDIPYSIENRSGILRINKKYIKVENELNEIRIHGNVPPIDVYIKLNHDLAEKSPTQRKYFEKYKEWVYAPFEYDDEVRNKYDDEIDKIDSGFLWGSKEDWEKLPSDLRRRIYHDMLEFKKKYNL